MDLFKVGSNIQSMQALNNLYKLNEKMSVHQSRLSTGKRVNSAQDDTAGFSVAKNVETTRQGYEQAHQNIKKRVGILSARQTNHHLVVLLEHPKILDSLAYQSSQLFVTSIHLKSFFTGVFES